MKAIQSDMGQGDEEKESIDDVIESLYDVIGKDKFNFLCMNYHPPCMMYENT